MPLAIAQDEVLRCLEGLSAERQRIALDFIKRLAQRDEEDDSIDLNEELKRALDDVRAGRVDRRDWRVALNEL